MSYRSETPLSDKAHGYVSAMPVIANTLMLVTTYFLLLLVVMPQWAASLLVAWALTNLIDGTNWFFALIKRRGDLRYDAWQVLNYWGLPTWSGILIGSAWIIVWWCAVLIP